MDLVQILLLFGALQALFLGAILLWRKQGRPNNVFLSIFLILISFQTYLFSMDGIYDFLGCTIVNMFSRLIFFAYGPLIYFYIRSLIDANFQWKMKDGVHFLPFILVGITSALSYKFWGEVEYNWLHYLANTHYFTPILHESIRLAYLLGYIGLSFYWLRKFDVASRDHLSNPTQVKISWLYQFLALCFVIWSIVALGIRINYFDGNPQSNEFQSLFFVLPLFIYWVSYKAFIHPMIFHKISLSEPKVLTLDQKNANGKYHNSGLTPEKADLLKTSLESIMSSKKPYLNPNLKLNDLAEICGVKPHHLSQVINENIGSNFYLYINSYRIEAAKKLLVDRGYTHLTIEAIAYESGFNAKSTFNTQFKKTVGCTPGQFRKGALSGHFKPA